MAESHLEFTKPAHVVGRYALYGRLAAGGMATVHLGRMMEADGMSRTVAVKRLHPQFCKDPEFVAMFIDEARLAARIKHPNVVETLDILTMGQELLLVMEYIRGECFSKLLRAARRKNLEPSIGVVGHIASGMLHGLHAAHEATDDRGEALNVVHRDISPQNVMIDVDGGVKVLDFGVAKASARIQITRDGQMKGKLSYMSPEQLQGMPVDRRADVFACGVVLWEALTRRRLFVGEDASEVLRKILRDEVPRPSEFVPELTPAMDEVVLRALCKDPERRYQTAEDLAVDIENVIGLASPADVTAWIYSVAGEILTKRERLLQEIERLGSEGLPVPSADPNAGGSVHGSITDSDTFQRIQSWAEREAARAVELPSRPSLELDDAGEALPTVADARFDNVGPGFARAPASTGDASRAPFDSAPAVPLDDAEVLDVEEEDDTSRAALPPPELSSLPVHAQPVPVFSHAPVAPTEASRRKRRKLALLSAAGVFGFLTLIAVVAVQPVALVRTSGALLPSSTSAVSASAKPSAPSSAVASNAVVSNAVVSNGVASNAVASNAVASNAVASNAVPGNTVASSAVAAGSAVAPASAPQQAPGSALARKGAAAEREPPIGQAVATEARVVRAAEPVRPAEPAAPAPGGAASEPGVDGNAASRVSLALVQLPKEHVPSTPKRATKYAPAPPPRRARAAAAAKAPSATPAAAAANNKLDCKQPFWIDEKGIRRLKMACL